MYDKVKYTNLRSSIDIYMQIRILHVMVLGLLLSTDVITREEFALLGVTTGYKAVVIWIVPFDT